MTKAQPLPSTPLPTSPSTLAVAVGLGTPLRGLIGSDRLRGSIESAFLELQRALGMPGDVSVSVAETRDAGLPGASILNLRVNAKIARYPIDLLRLVHAYVAGSALPPEVTLRPVIEWLNQTGETNPALLVEFVVLACTEIAKLHPVLLLTDGYVQEIQNRTAAGLPEESRLSAGYIRQVLEPALEAGVSIGDADVALTDGEPRDARSVAELLISSGQTGEIEVRLPPEYLRTLSTASLADWHAGFQSLHEGMVNELGTPLPKFHFVVDEQLRPETFRFKINQILTPPVLGLRIDECLVNETADRVEALRVKARATLNAASGYPSSVAPLEKRQYLESSGLIVWDARDFVILLAAETVRRRAHFFTDEEATDKLLRNLRRSFPQIVSVVESTFSTHQITNLLRGLVAEQVSVRNMHRVCECIADTEAQPDEIMRLESVRSCLRREISAKVARSSAVLVAYLLGESMVELLQRQPGSSLVEGDCDRILAAIYAELAHLPPTALVPAVITTADTRHTLRRVVQHEFPRLMVLAPGELAPDVVIQPVARIEL